MRRIYNTKKKDSLKDNLRRILPVMFDDFMELREAVVSKPLAKNTLHRMRISGKPLRYAMEIGETAFGEEFAKCFGEVKDAVELMGEIHDADVLVPEISSHMNEIRIYNKTLTVNSHKISTRVLRFIIISERRKRREMYAELCTKLNFWSSSDLRQKMVDAMDVRFNVINGRNIKV